MKRLLITGGSSDIAYEIIKELDKEYNITYTCSNEQSLVKMQKRYTDTSAKGIIYKFGDDFSEKFDIIILNACSKVKELKTFHELNTVKEMEYLSSNILGNMQVIKASLPYMISENFGRIILISSLSTQTATSKYSSYIMLKSALEGLISNIAVDYSQYNILSNTLRLGIFKTSRNRMIWKRQKYQEKINQQILLNRMGRPADVIAPIKLLIA